MISTNESYRQVALERGGKRQERIQFAAAEKTLTELEQREILRRLTFDVQTAYVDAQSALAAVALAASAWAAHADDTAAFYRGKTVNLLISTSPGASVPWNSRCRCPPAAASELI